MDNQDITAGSVPTRLWLMKVPVLLYPNNTVASVASVIQLDTTNKRALWRTLSWNEWSLIRGDLTLRHKCCHGSDWRDESCIGCCCCAKLLSVVVFPSCSLYIGAQDAVVTAYPTLDDKHNNIYSRPELVMFIWVQRVSAREDKKTNDAIMLGLMF